MATAEEQRRKRFRRVCIGLVNQAWANLESASTHDLSVAEYDAISDAAEATSKALRLLETGDKS